MAEPCPPLPDYTDINIGEGLSNWQKDRQQYVQCSNSKNALIDAIKAKESITEKR